jgi:anti-sigma factor ChrR (cupin superfamily)
MLNMNFADQVTIATREKDWEASPMPGVWRKRLAREEAERGHATSIVRYDAGARFRAHNHPGGEEILVLSGVFSDELGDFPAGTYFRNPAGYRHAPFSDQGCELLVKLHQIPDHDDQRVQVNTLLEEGWRDLEGGGQELLLHHCDPERVCLLRLPPGTQLPSSRLFGGAELYLMQGALLGAKGRLEERSWSRFPAGWNTSVEALEASLLWFKSGHLPAVSTDSASTGA